MHVGPFVLPNYTVLLFTENDLNPPIIQELLTKHDSYQHNTEAAFALSEHLEHLNSKITQNYLKFLRHHPANEFPPPGTTHASLTLLKNQQLISIDE